MSAAVVADPRSPLACMLDAAATVEEGDQATAWLLLDSLLRDGASDATADTRLADLFASALRVRLSGDGADGGNLYQGGHGPADMLAAFQVLLHHTPFVRFGHAAANAVLARTLAGARRAHLVDLGIGSGIQWPGLIEGLAARGGPTPRLRLTGVDLPEPGPDPAARLRQVGGMLRDQAARAGLPFEYAALASSIERLDLECLRAGEEETVAVNAAFALHHVLPGEVSPDPTGSRDAVLHRLRRLRPSLLTLVEPDSDHNTADFVQRVRAAFGHYRAIFDALAALLPAHPEEREVIERAFFGREIHNIVAGEGPRRIERHERHATWRRRLREAGFEPVDFTREDVAAVVTALAHQVSGISITAAPGALTLAWKGTPLVVASAWRGR